MSGRGCLGILLVGMFIVGCKDKAEAKFREAEAAQKGGKLIEAVSLYQQATQADPTSRLGKQAAERVAELGPLAEKEQKRIDEENEKRRAAEAAARPPVEANKIQCVRARAIDDVCEGEGRLGFTCTGGSSDEVEDEFASCDRIAGGRFCCRADASETPILNHAKKR